MIEYDESTAALIDAYAGVTRLVEGLAPADFLKPTRCSAWAVGDLLFHLLRDAQRALIAFVTPADGPPDVDFVTYWQPFSADHADAAAYAHSARIGAASFPRSSALVETWIETSEAALRAAAGADPAGRITTQDLVLAVPDFIATLAVEAAIHHLDMTVALPDAPLASERPLALVRRTLQGLLGGPPPPGWSDEELALKGTGRLPLSPDDQVALGDHADRLPLFS